MLTVMSALSSILIDRDGDVAVVVLQGEHDLSTADRVRARGRRRWWSI